MRAIEITAPGRVRLVERPRPAVTDPGDAVVMVTTAGLTAWDIARCMDPRIDPGLHIPGGEFAGNVVETGPGVRQFAINDTVIAVSGWLDASGRHCGFGRAGLDGAHADYVRVPDADRNLVSTTASAEERSLLAGFTLSLGATAYDLACEHAPGDSVVLLGCDPLGIAVLAAMQAATGGRREQARRGKLIRRILALDNHPARLALARRFGAETLDLRQPGVLDSLSPVDCAIVGALSDLPWNRSDRSLTPDSSGPSEAPGHSGPSSLPQATLDQASVLIFTEPDGPARWRCIQPRPAPRVRLHAPEWPDQGLVKRTATNVLLRRQAYVSLVSHVIPLDQAEEAYQQACDRAPGVQKVLLKP